jgi:hypothetical protein
MPQKRRQKSNVFWVEFKFRRLDETYGLDQRQATYHYRLASQEGALRMIFFTRFSKLLVFTVLLVGDCSLAVARGEAAKAALPKPRQPAKITFAIHAYDGVIQTIGWGPLKAEFEKRGFSCKIVRSPNTKTKTPHQDRAKVMVEALKNVEGDIVLVGISNQGLFMPLVAAERPIRRIVMINAVVPSPGKSFQEAFDFEKVFATKFARRLAQRAPGMSEVCPLRLSSRLRSRRPTLADLSSTADRPFRGRSPLPG